MVRKIKPQKKQFQQIDSHEKELCTVKQNSQSWWKKNSQEIDAACIATKKYLKSASLDRTQHEM